MDEIVGMAAVMYILGFSPEEAAAVLFMQYDPELVAQAMDRAIEQIDQVSENPKEEN